MAGIDADNRTDTEVNVKERGTVEGIDHHTKIVPGPGTSMI